MARVEIPAPGDLVIDSLGNVLSGRSVTLVLAGTATAVTHYSALTGGTSTTGGLVTSTTGTVVNGSGNVRYIENGTDVEMTVAGVTRRLNPTSGGTPEFHVKRYLAFSDPVQEAINAAAASSVSGGEVVLSEATWTRSTTLSWAQGVKLRGEGPAARIHYTGSGVAVQFGSGALDVTNWTRLSARDIKLTGTGSATSGLKVRGATRWDVQGLTIDGFTAGSGILLNGASFIGKIGGGRITNCSIGISMKKQAGDGSAGAGQAGNALEVCDQMEIQTCGTAIEIGDPAAAETLPVVAMSVHIHDITVEGNTRGIRNVSGYSVKTSKIYYELNVEYDEQIGTAANTISPIAHVAEDNFHNLAGAPLAYDVVRADTTTIERPFIIGKSLASITGVGATNLLTKASHGLLANTPIAFTALTGGAGLVTGTVYYVIASGLTTNDFKISATLGGAEFDFTTDISAATLTAGRAWQTTASTAVHTRIESPRYSNLATSTPYVDSGSYTVHATREQNGGVSPYELRTGGLWSSRGVFAGPFIQIAGAVTDAAVTSAGWPTPVNGMVALDTTTGALWKRLASAWTLLRSPQYEQLQAGFAAGLAHEAFTIVAGRGYAVRFVATSDKTITKIGFTVTTVASADDACDVAILDATGARLKSAGATSGKLNTSTGQKTVTLSSSQALTAGTAYYAAFSAVTPFGGTAAQLMGENRGSGLSFERWGQTMGLLEGSHMSTHPIGSSWTPVLTTTAAMPALLVLE